MNQTCKNLAFPLLAVAALGLSVACTDGGTQPTAATGAQAQRAAVQRNDWIVRFHDDVAEPVALAQRLANEHGGRLHAAFHNTIKGFSATLPPQAVDALRRNPHVAYIIPDAEANLAIQGLVTVPANTWGLDRIDQRSRALNGTYTYYTTGQGVTVYVMDTGIDTGHPEFGGRASVGYDHCYNGDCRNGQDPHGHGTHVAGIIGSSTYGVAKNASLVSIRVTDSGANGNAGSFIAGFDTVAGFKRRAPSIVPVLNVSLIYGKTALIDTAAIRAVNAGVTVVAGAGNTNANACNYSPGHNPQVITVAATDSLDRRASGSNWTSNWGTCVDLFAPGDSILSTFPRALIPAGFRRMSGTSQASPHVAGWSALYLQNYSLSKPADVQNAVIYYTTRDSVINAGTGTPNRLLYTHWSTGRTPGCCR